MAVTMVLTRTATIGGRSYGGEVSRSAGLPIELNESLPIGTDTAFGIAFAFAKVLAYHLQATTALKIEANSGSAPDWTIDLLPGEPQDWASGDEAASLMTANVTGLFMTNAAATVLTGWILVDPT